MSHTAQDFRILLSQPHWKVGMVRRFISGRKFGNFWRRNDQHFAGVVLKMQIFL